MRWFIRERRISCLCSLGCDSCTSLSGWWWWSFGYHAWGLSLQSQSPHRRRCAVCCWKVMRFYGSVSLKGFKNSLFQGPEDALSPCLGLGDILFDSLLLVVQIVDNIIVIVKPIVVHVAVLQESWSRNQRIEVMIHQRNWKGNSPHPVLIQLHSFRREFFSRGISGTNFFIIHFLVLLC